MTRWKRRALLLALVGLCNPFASSVIAIPMATTSPPALARLEPRAPEPLETQTLQLVYWTSYTTVTVSTALILERTSTQVITTTGIPVRSRTGSLTTPIRTHTMTITTTAGPTLNPHKEPKKRQEELGADATDSTITTVVSTGVKLTRTETKYTSTATIYITTTTRLTTVPPTATFPEPKGLWTQITWVTMTATVQPTISKVEVESEMSRSLDIKVVAGSTVGVLSVVVAATCGACFYMQRRSDARRAQKAKGASFQGRAYSRVASGPGDLGEGGLGIRTPETPGLMGTGVKMPPPGVGNFHQLPQTPATPGFGQFSPVPLDSDSVPPIPPHLNAPGVQIIPPSSTASLRTSASPTTSAYFENSGTLPAIAGRNRMYTHLSPPIPTSEFPQTPGSASKPSSHERSGSLSGNIMPPPLREYRAVSDVSSTSTMVHGDFSTNLSPVGSVSRQGREHQGDYDEEERPLISPMSPPSRTATWGKFGDPVIRKSIGESPSKKGNVPSTSSLKDSVPSLPPINRSTTPQQEWLVQKAPEEEEKAEPKKKLEPQDQLSQSYYW